MHGSRTGLILPDLRCRAWVLDHECDCPDYVPEEN
ncbi:hypothetical protein HDG69_001366 [Isoptericola halotolerans]|uniref:Uncharacterized protein n=1 Tax=Isoptericola halotolerans TaxID=300560 RepID=A0ABX2A4G5_9MICO|nr:hypothetical protein [Isoptericola halotolerans]